MGNILVLKRVAIAMFWVFLVGAGMLLAGYFEHQLHLAGEYMFLITLMLFMVGGMGSFFLWGAYKINEWRLKADTQERI